MNMKTTIFNLWQTASQRLLFCALASCLSALPAMAQSEDEEDEAVETSIKQPTRKAAQAKYPTVNLHGVVTDQATGKPLSGVQLQALGHIRYTAMSDEDGSFTINVPTFATSLYVHSAGYMPQQVGIIAGDSTQQVSVAMLRDKFLPMYGTGTQYTASSTAEISKFGVTVDNEVASKLGGDMPWPALPPSTVVP